MNKSKAKSNTLIRSDRNLLALGLIAIALLIGVFSFVPKPNFNSGLTQDTLNQTDPSFAAENLDEYEKVPYYGEIPSEPTGYNQ